MERRYACRDEHRYRMLEKENLCIHPLVTKTKIDVTVPVLMRLALRNIKKGTSTQLHNERQCHQGKGRYGR